MVAEIINQKPCSVCDQTKPITEFYKDPRRPNGLRSECKSCANCQNRQYVASHEEQIRSYRKRYRRKHRERLSECNRQRYQENREQNNAASRAWYRANKEQHQEAGRKWRQRFPEHSRAIKHNHKRIKQGVVGACTAEQWIARCQFYGWCCYLCGVSLANKTLQMEHRIPLCRGGTYWPSNLAPACKPCNQSKDKLTEREYRARLAWTFV